VFPFASLHPNADAKLRADITLLPSHLVSPPCIDHDGVCAVDNTSTSAVSPNQDVQEFFVEERAQNPKESSSTAHEMLEDTVAWSGTEYKVDSGTAANPL
jgi:hypothetical protein